MEPPIRASAPKHPLNLPGKDAAESACKNIDAELQCPVSFEAFVSPMMLTDCGHFLSRLSLNLLKAKNIKVDCPLCKKAVTEKEVEDQDLTKLTQPILECLEQANSKNTDLSPLYTFDEEDHRADYLLSCGHVSNPRMLAGSEKINDVSKVLKGVHCSHKECNSKTKRTAYPHRTLRNIAAEISKFVRINDDKLSYVKALMESDLSTPEAAEKAALCVESLSPEEEKQFKLFLLDFIRIQLSKKNVKKEPIIAALKLLKPQSRIEFLITNLFSDASNQWFVGLKAVKAKEAFCQIFDESVAEVPALKERSIEYHIFWFQSALSLDVGTVTDVNYKLLDDFRTSTQARLNNHPLFQADMDWKWIAAHFASPVSAGKVRDTFNLGVNFVNDSLIIRGSSAYSEPLMESVAHKAIACLNLRSCQNVLIRILALRPQLLPKLVPSLNRFYSETRRLGLSAEPYFLFWTNCLRYNQMQRLGQEELGVISHIFDCIDESMSYANYLPFLNHAHEISCVVDALTPNDQSLAVRLFNNSCTYLKDYVNDPTHFLKDLDLLYSKVTPLEFEIEISYCMLLLKCTAPTLPAVWSKIFNMMDRIPEASKRRFTTLVSMALCFAYPLNIRSFITIFKFLYNQNQIRECLSFLVQLNDHIDFNSMDKDLDFAFKTMEYFVDLILEIRVKHFGNFSRSYALLATHTVGNICYVASLNKGWPPVLVDKIFEMINFKENDPTFSSSKARGKLITEWIKRIVGLETLDSLQLAKSILRKGGEAKIFQNNLDLLKEATDTISIAQSKLN